MFNCFNCLFVNMLGRRSCYCEATNHDLIANCLNCGRIVCAQEGTGDCFTCGSHVFTRQERQQLQLMINKSNQLKKQQMNKSNSQTDLKSIALSLKKANEHKDKMLDFDKNASVRTKVIDDEMDYFSLANQHWITNEKRQQINSKVEDLHEKKFKRNTKILINLQDKTASDYSEPVIDLKQEVEKLQSESQLNNDYHVIDASKLIHDEQNNDDDKIKLDYISPKGVIISEKNKEAKKLAKKLSKFKVQDENE